MARSYDLGTAHVLALAACAWLCGGGHADEKKTPETRTAVLITEKDNGKTVALAAKEHLLVALEFGAGTEYQWRLKGTPDELRLVHHYIVKPFTAQPIGGTRLAGFDFGPAAAGTGDLEFDLVAPGGSTAKTVKITVTVEKTK